MQSVPYLSRSRDGRAACPKAREAGTAGPWPPATGGVLQAASACLYLAYEYSAVEHAAAAAAAVAAVVLAADFVVVAGVAVVVVVVVAIAAAEDRS